MSEIKIVRDKIQMSEISKLALGSFIDYVKAVVDVKRRIMAIGGSMHADAEEILLKDGSVQENLWGVNISPGKPAGQRIEYISLINIRPRQNNRSMEVQSGEIRSQIKTIVDKLIAK